MGRSGPCSGPAGPTPPSMQQKKHLALPGRQGKVSQLRMGVRDEVAPLRATRIPQRQPMKRGHLATIYK